MVHGRVFVGLINTTFALTTSPGKAHFNLVVVNQTRDPSGTGTHDTI
jgi:hypothetical protein